MDAEKLRKTGSNMALEGAALQEWVDKKITEHMDMMRLSAQEAIAKEEAETRKIEMERQATQAKTELAEKEIELLKLRKETSDLNSSVSSDRTDGDVTPVAQKAKMPRLPNFDSTRESVDDYLCRFERHSKINNFPRTTWATVLSSLLTGSALEVYTRLSEADAEDYTALKSALYKRFNVSVDSARTRFRETTLDKGETYEQLHVRLTKRLDKWLQLEAGDSSAQEEIKNTVVQDLMLREQFMRCCTRELQIYIRQQEPASSSGMAAIADKWSEARKYSSSSITTQVKTMHVESKPEVKREFERREGSKKRCTFCNTKHPTKAHTHNIDTCFMKDRKQ